VRFRLFLFLSLAFLLSTSREPPWADAHVTYDTSQALVDRFELDVHLEAGPPWFYAHHDGKKYGVFPLGNVVAMAPSYLFYKVIRTLQGHPWSDGPTGAPRVFVPGKKPAPPELLPDRAVFAFASHLSPALMMAAACMLFFQILRRRVGNLPPLGARKWALFGTLTLAFGTFVFIYARSPYSEALQTLAMTWMIERTLDQAESPTVGGLAWLAIAAGLLCNSKLVYVLVLPLVAAYLIYCWRRDGKLGAAFRRTPLALFAFAELAALALWHNRLKTGSWWDSGYTIKDGVFSGDLFSGIYGFLLSPGKGWFFYCPPLILGLFGLATAWRRRRAETALFVGIMIVCLAFNAKFRHWHADYCWGPRHLVSITPLMLLLAFPWLPEAVGSGRRWLRRSALGMLLGLGLSVQLLGAMFYWDHFIRILIAAKDETGAIGWYQENLSHGHYIPVFSPIRGHWWMLRHLVHNDAELDRDTPWKSVVPQPARLDEAWGRFRIDWWIFAFTEGANKAQLAAALVLWATLAGGTAAAALSLRRQIESGPLPKQ
jgi:hypothetical protein